MNKQRLKDIGSLVWLLPRAVFFIMCFTTLGNTAYAVDQWHWYIDSNHNGVTNQDDSYGLTTDTLLPADYNGDGITDYAVVRIENDNSLSWYIDTNRDGSTDILRTFGQSGDRTYAADYNNDGRADFAVVRKSGGNLRWYIDTDRNGTTDISATFGVDSDMSYPADYNGDGRADFAVVRKSNGNLRWYIDTNRNGTTDISATFGVDSDIPHPADYNGDYMADLAVARSNSNGWTWYLDTNRDSVTDITRVYGQSTDSLLPADYNGDGATDFAALRRTDAHWVWYVDCNLDGLTDMQETYGLSSDLPRPADFDGDGADDFAVARRGWSNLTYRIPYANGTDVYIWNDVASHGPLGRIDMYGTGGNGTYRVVAAQSGEVVAMDDSNTVSCQPPDTCQNNYVWLRHNNGEWTKYSHIAQNSASITCGLSVGDHVDIGDCIGIEDDVGYAPRNHLHFEVAVPLDETNPLTSTGYIRGWNRVPRICDIGGGTFVKNENYVADNCN